MIDHLHGQDIGDDVLEDVESSVAGGKSVDVDTVSRNSSEMIPGLVNRSALENSGNSVYESRNANEPHPSPYNYSISLLRSDAEVEEKNRDFSHSDTENVDNLLGVNHLCSDLASSVLSNIAEADGL